MAAITATQLRARLAGMLRVAANDTTIDSSSPWDQIITDACDWGYQEILSVLTLRGYSVTQINTWARLTEYNVSLSLFWCLTMGAGLHSYDDKFINKLDRREELLTVLLLDDDGDLIEIDDSAGRIRGGVLDTSADLFTLDPDDPRRGVPTEF